MYPFQVKEGGRTLSESMTMLCSAYTKIVSDFSLFNTLLSSGVEFVIFTVISTFPPSPAVLNDMFTNELSSAATETSELLNSIPAL